ncbi:prepilin-type N-terminal cleavage/methylation domain-containing protein [Lachnospiraceae bacterium RM5]|nr:prepilin-type N-terminal cleavage/methylation domain-containing protein [Lachnospiraceae bacterium RM5]
MKKMNNKGFSLIELIIVIAIMAILVAIIAPNLTKYLGKSKSKTDAKNADEIAQQIQTAITDYETDNGELTTGTITVTWNSSGAVYAANTAFQDILNENITNSTQSKEDSSYATATIAKSGGKYTITVTVGKQSTKR